MNAGIDRAEGTKCELVIGWGNNQCEVDTLEVLEFLHDAFDAVIFEVQMLACKPEHRDLEVVVLSMDLLEPKRHHCKRCQYIRGSSSRKTLLGHCEGSTLIQTGI